MLLALEKRKTPCHVMAVSQSASIQINTPIYLTEIAATPTRLCTQNSTDNYKIYEKSLRHWNYEPMESLSNTFCCTPVHSFNRSVILLRIHCIKRFLSNANHHKLDDFGLFLCKKNFIDREIQ